MGIRSMKHKIEKRSEIAMSYFTPELYLQFNSTDNVEADRADEAWEDAIKKYRSYLRKHSNEMPPRVKKFADTVCLHDAELLEIKDGVSESDFWLQSPPIVAILTLKQNSDTVTLNYMLWDRVIQSEPRNGWPWSEARSCWLYDEIKLKSRRPNLFHHRILLSDGRIILIPFFDLQIEIRQQQSGESTSQTRFGLPRRRIIIDPKP